MADDVDLTGVGTSEQMPSALSNWTNRAADARAQGLGWDAIGQALQQKRQALIDQGISEKAINQAMGIKDGTDLNNRLRSVAEQNIAASQPEKPETSTAAPLSLADQVADLPSEFIKGLKGGVSGIPFAAGKPLPDAPDHAEIGSSIAFHAGVAVSDIPGMVAGAMVGAPLGAAAGAAAGAAFGPEGAAAGGSIGGPIGLSAGMLAAPAFIRGEYAAAITRGDTTGPRDFLSRQMGVLWDTAKAATVGALTGGAGVLAGKATEAMGAGVLTQVATKTSAELTTMTTAAAAMEGHLPTAQNFVDNAVLIGLMHGTARTMEGAHTVFTNLADNWAKTGQPPSEAVRQAANDPVLRQELTVAKPPEPPAGSSETMTPQGALVLPMQPSLRTTVVTQPAIPSGTEAAAPAGGVAAGGGAGIPGAPNPPAAGGPAPGGTPGVVAPNWAAASARWAHETQESFLARVKKNMWSVYGELFDPQYPINQMVDKFKDGGGQLDAADNPRMLYRATENSGTVARVFIERGAVDARDRTIVGESLNSIVDQFNHERGDRTFWNYALARTTLEDTTKDTGLNPIDAVGMVQDGQADYEDAYKRVVEWRNSGLRYAHHQGVISYDQMTAMRERDTLPLFRQEAEAGAREHANGQTQQGGGGVGRTREGSGLPILNIRANLMREIFSRTQFADNARANRALVDLASRLGVANRIDAGTVANPMTAGQQINLPGWDFAGDRVPIIRDGNVETWRFDDPHITETLKGLNEQQLSTVEGWVKSISRFQRNAIVLNPAFPVRIFSYDPVWQTITNPDARNSLMNIWSGVGTFFDRDSWDRWAASGGAENVFRQLGTSDYIQDTMRGMEDPAFTDQVWNRIKMPFQGLQAWARMITQFQRAGRFTRGLQAGEPVEQAAANASDTAFHRSAFGGPMAMRINALHPFFTAYLKGLDQGVKSFFGIGRTVSGTPYQASTALMKAGLWITLPTMAAWAAWHDEEWYKRVPDWQKDAGIPTPWGFIPLPPVINFLFGGVPRRLAEAYIADNPHASNQLVGGMLGSMIPPTGMGLIANVAEPVFDKIANYSFFRGQPLNNASAQKRLPEYQWSNYSTETGKNIAKFLSDVPLVRGMHMTPVETDNFIKSFPLADAAVRYTESALQAGGVIKTNAPSPRAQDFPLFSSFVTRMAPSGGAQPINDFRERHIEVQQFGGSINALLKAGQIDEAVKLIKDHPVEMMFTSPGGMTNGVMQEPKALQPVQAALEKAQQDFQKDPAKVKAFETIQTAIKNMSGYSQMADAIGQFPTNEPLKPLSQQALSEIQANLKNPPKPSLSNNDKRQLLDQIYSTMQVNAEAGNRALDQLKVR